MSEQPINHHTGIIYLMVIVSASDGEMNDSELRAIGDVITKFPVFRDFETSNLTKIAAACGEILSEDDGLETILKLANETIPEKLHETAYAAAVEIAVADDSLGQEELRILELIRHALRIERLSAGAIERSARARHAVI